MSERVYLVNPRRARRRKRRRKLYGAAAAAHAKKLARKSRRKYRHNAPKKGTAQMARKKKVVRRRRHRRPKLRTRARRAVRAVRRRARRAGRITTRKILPMVMQGVKDGAGVVVGVAAVKALPGLVGMGGKTGVTKYGIGALSALVAGYGAHRFLGANVGRNVLAGGFAAVIMDVVKDANIPVISAALGDYGYAAYPPANVLMPGTTAALTGYGEYPDAGMDDVAFVQYMQ